MMDGDEARDILLGAGGQTVRIGSPLAIAIETTLAWNERLGNLYDAREAEVLELLREQRRLERRVQAVRDAWARVDDARPPQGLGDLFEALEAL
jgi:hypothetical protein